MESELSAAQSWDASEAADSIATVVGSMLDQAGSELRASIATGGGDRLSIAFFPLDLPRR